MTVDEIYQRVDDLNAYLRDTLKFGGVKVEINLSSNDRNALYIWGELAEVLLTEYRKREEGLEPLFAAAWSWAYNQPSPEKRELNAWIKKLSGTLEELGEGHSEIVRDLYRKLFDLRETASNHLLEYQGGE